MLHIFIAAILPLTPGLKTYPIVFYLGVGYAHRRTQMQRGGQALASDCQNGQAYAAKIGKAKVLVASSNSIVHHTAPVGWLGAVPPHQSPHPASSATDEESPITVL